MQAAPSTAEDFNRFGAGLLPAHLGIQVTQVQGGEVHAHFDVQPFLLAPNGFLHAGSVVTLADTAAGYGCVANLPEGASGFTTVELKSNHLGTAREGRVLCVARAVHLGRTTQVWDAVVTSQASGKTMALFRCTQMVLYAKAQEERCR
jgi:1,4-dihydroxy-2-naphthoyl-CoA hydrolase